MAERAIYALFRKVTCINADYKSAFYGDGLFMPRLLLDANYYSSLELTGRPKYVLFLGQPPNVA
jgi:hypothetical protein